MNGRKMLTATMEYENVNICLNKYVGICLAEREKIKSKWAMIQWKNLPFFFARNTLRNRRVITVVSATARCTCQHQLSTAISVLIHSFFKRRFEAPFHAEHFQSENESTADCFQFNQ